VRFSSGGLPFVKAAGFLVRGLAQVSMNLTDFEQTPIYQVFEMVKHEARAQAVAIESSEIIGLIPKKALEQAAAWFLQVGSFDSSLILENRLASVMSAGGRAGGLRGGVEPFLERLAAPTGTPGGGSAAAAAAAMAAGLATMVASMSRGKKAYLEYGRELGEAIARLTELREELTAAIDQDADAYDGVVKAYRQARASAGGEGSVNAALERATRVPLEVAQRALEVAGIAETLGPITNPNMRSDLATAVALAKAGVEGARSNVEINLESLKDGPLAAELRQKLAALQG
jgi:glutamate formiminotransferase/formiminotetrahydrofolate cyclodeaminase